MSFTPTPQDRRYSSVTSPRSFFHPMRHILPFPSVPPASRTFRRGRIILSLYNRKPALYPLSSLYHSLLPSFLFCGHFCIYKTLEFLLFCTIRPMFTLSRLVTLVALPGYSCHRCSFTFPLFLSLYSASVAHAVTGVIVSPFQSCVCNRYNFHPPVGFRHSLSVVSEKFHLVRSCGSSHVIRMTAEAVI